MSLKFTYDKEDVKKIIKVLLYSFGSALCTAGISLTGVIQTPTEYMGTMVVINTILVAIRKFLDGKSV